MTGDWVDPYPDDEDPPEAYAEAETCDACGVALSPEQAEIADFCEPCVDAYENAPEPEPPPVCYCGSVFTEQVFMETAKCANGHYGRVR